MILSIIEDKPRFDISILIYKIAILVSFVQILMYIFNEFELKNQDETKLKSLFQISQMVSVVNMLNLKGNDSLSILVYIVSQLFMYLYFIYVALLTIAKEYLKEYYEQSKSTITIINEFLNIYFTFFLNVFLTYYIELNSSLLFCSKYSLLQDMRDQFKENPSVCSIPSWQTWIAGTGLSLSIITALITNYYFRNYQFLETNALKRKSTFLFTFLIFARMFITFMEFNGDFSARQTVKHFSLQIFGLICILDYFISIPFTDQEISKFYLVTLAYFQGIVTCSHFFFFSNVINGQEMFYLCLIITLILSAFLQQGLRYRYDQILKTTWELEKVIPELDYFLEQFILLGQKSICNEEAKIILQKTYKLHRSGCKIISCICHQYIALNMKMSAELPNQSSNQNNSKISNNGIDAQREQAERDYSKLMDSEINMRIVYKFVDSIFQWMFSQKCISSNTYEFEKLSLKYISFMIQYQNNFVRAYYELKVLQLKKSSYSIYFKMVSNIIGINIQHKIESSFDDEMGEGIESKGGRGRESSGRKKHIANNKASLGSELTVRIIIDVEILCQNYIPRFLSIIQQKHDLWSKLQQGYKNLNDFQKDAINVTKQISGLKILFNKDVRKIVSQNPDIMNSLQFQKLCQIYYLFIVNDTIKAVQQEILINELKKRDSLAEHDQLKNVSMIKGDICVLEVSLSENFGKIMSKKDDKAALFFGYQEKQDFIKVNHVNDLMPNYISRVHNQLVKNYIQGTSMRSKNGNNIVYSFIKQNDGYVIPVKIHLDFSFTTSLQDFRMNAILLKNRMVQEHILFHRSGKMVGMTKNLAKMIFQDFHKLPSGDSAVSRLNALLLFPTIIKKIITGREQILQDLERKNQADQLQSGDSGDQVNSNSKSAYTSTQIFEDLEGSMRFSSNPYSSTKRFFNFLSKKSNSSSQGFRQINRVSELDLLDKSCLKLLKQFENVDIGQSTNRSHHNSSERLLSARGQFGQEFEELNTFNKTIQLKTISTMQKTNQFNPEQLMEYKMKFNYSLSYQWLNQSSRPSQAKVKKQEGLQYVKVNEQKQNNYDNSFPDIFFDLCIENITIKYKPKKIKYKAMEGFIRNLCTYFKSTTSVVPISNQTEKLNLFKTGASMLETIDEINQDSQQNPKMSNLSTQIMENLAPPLSLSIQEEFISFPKKMLKLLKASFDNSAQLDEQSVDNKWRNRDESILNKNDSSYKSYRSQTEDNEDNKSDDYNFDKIYTNVMNQVYNNKQGKDSQDSHSLQLEAIMSQYCIAKNILPSVDPNYPVKKILQNRSLSCALSTALENALTENILQLELEKRQPNNNNQDMQLQSNLESFQHNPIRMEDIQQPITFRQKSDISNHIDKIPSNLINNLYQNNAQLIAQSNLIMAQYEKNSGNITQMSEQLEDINNVSKQANYINIDTDNNLGASFVLPSPSQRYNQPGNIDQSKMNKSQLDISARPILDQSNIHLENIELTYSTHNNNPLGQELKKQNSYINNNQLTTNIADEKYNILRQDNDKKVEYNIQVSQIDDNMGKKTIKLIQSQMEQPPISSKLNSSDKDDNDENEENEQNKAQEKAIANILNQKGIANEKNNIQQSSVHSSSRNSSSYAGNFLKEIILQCKIPKAAEQYRILLIIFLVSFISLNVANLMIIRNDMQIFSDNVIILRQPRKFLRAFGKSLFGYYLSLEKLAGYFDDPDNKYQTIYEEYVTSGVQEYKDLSEQFTISLTQLRQSQQDSTGEGEMDFSVFQRRQQQDIKIDFALLFFSQQLQILGLEKKQEEHIQVDSFLYLRQNYFTFSSQVQNSVDFLVQNTLDTVDNLIYKFTVIIICAIIGVILVSLISLPIIKSINYYEEKIMMIVTRINYDQSDLEKCKLQVCKQLINVDFIDWLNYNYFDIFSLSTQKQNVTGLSQSSKHQSQFNNQKLLSSKLKSKSKAKPQQVIEEQQLQSNLLLGQSTTMQLNKKESQQKLGKSNFFSSNVKGQHKVDSPNFKLQKNAMKKKAQMQKESIQNNTNNSTKNNNYLLQSKIQSQSLRVFDRFLVLLTLTFFNCVYFLVVIIYLTQSKDQLKVPVIMNQRSINLHIIQINMKIAVELLAFDYYVQEELWSDYSVKDLKEFYNQINKSLKDIQTISQLNTDVIYGTNPFPSDVVQKLKDVQEGRGCQYLEKYKCSSESDQLGLRTINANKQKFIAGYPDLINPEKSDPKLLRAYLNGEDHIKEFVLSFQSEDELFDVYSSSINLSITTVTQQIQDFIQQYLIVAGCLFAIIILLVFILNWRFLYIRLQQMNLLLIIIPEEKLQEDVTMHMIRQLYRM